MASVRHLVVGKLSVPKPQKYTLGHTQTWPYLPLLQMPTTFEHTKNLPTTFDKKPICKSSLNPSHFQCIFHFELGSKCPWRMATRANSKSGWIPHWPIAFPFHSRSLPHRARGRAVSRGAPATGTPSSLVWVAALRGCRPATRQSQAPPITGATRGHRQWV